MFVHVYTCCVCTHICGHGHVRENKSHHVPTWGFRLAWYNAPGQSCDTDTATTYLCACSSGSTTGLSSTTCESWSLPVWVRVFDPSSSPSVYGHKNTTAVRRSSQSSPSLRQKEVRHSAQKKSVSLPKSSLSVSRHINTKEVHLCSQKKSIVLCKHILRRTKKTKKGKHIVRQFNSVRRFNSWPS